MWLVLLGGRYRAAPVPCRHAAFDPRQHRQHDSKSGPDDVLVVDYTERQPSGSVTGLVRLERRDSC
jgi:hypothetical protein